MAPLRHLVAAVAFVVVPGVAAAQATADPSPAPARPRRGPFEARDEWLLVQDHLTLPAVSPDPLGRGRTRARIDLDWGSDFGWDQDLSGEEPGDRRYLVDGEHRTVALDLRRGITDTADLGLRVPLRWRGGGILDGIIDGFHDAITNRIGLPDNGRPDFLRGQLRALGRDAAFRPVVWQGRPGLGLGNVELAASWALRRPASPDGWAGALVSRLSLPTGQGPFGGSGLEAGVQYATAKRFGSRVDFYAGAGGAFLGDREVEGIRYRRLRFHGFTALEWRLARRFAVLAQTDVSSRLVTNLARYPGVQSYLKLGGRLDLSRNLALEGGFTENLVNQDATTDFGIFLALARRF